MEVAPDSQIREFRAILEPSVQFNRVDQLPELVGAVVTQRLQATQRLTDIGLRDWERAYLDFRLPAWRLGRTARSQPHLFDAGLKSCISLTCISHLKGPHVIGSEARTVDPKK